MGSVLTKYFKDLKTSKKRYHSLIILSLFALPLSAQLTPKTFPNIKYNVTILANKTVEIQFNAPQNIYNVLVVIRDDSGNTVFLENQYNFKGPYKRTVHLSATGVYYLKIVNDDDIMNKKLIIP